MASTNAAPPSTKGNAYTPALPLQLSWKSVMSQDVVTTASIPVDSTSASPVAVFHNPASRHTEALVITNVAGKGKQVAHVKRNLSTDGGWQLVPLFNGRAATEVAAGTAYAGSPDAAVYGFFQDSAALNVTQLATGGASWSSPQTISAVSAAHLRVAYSPAGRLVLYGHNGQGDLVTAHQPGVGGAFVGTVCAMGGDLSQGDFQLCMTDESTWTILANVNGQPQLFSGDLGATAYSSKKQATEFTGTLKQVVLGYWSDAQNTLIFLLADDDSALHAWVSNAPSSTVIAQPIPNSKVTGATGHVAADRSLHVYSIDDGQRLWALHQSPGNPWNDDGTPNWAPYLPIDTGISAVVGDANPADAPSLFALDAAESSLRFHAQDPHTRMWRSGAVLQHAAQAFETVRFRTELNLIDSNGTALPYQPVTVSVLDGDSATELWAGGKIYPVNSKSEVQLTTDATGKLTLAVLTTAGMATPRLVVRAAGLPQPVTIQPSESIHTYLSGQGTLNPTNPGGALPAFDAAGKTLSSATVGGRPLAPGAQASQALAGTAAGAIQHTAMVGLGKPVPGVVAYAGRFHGAGGAEFNVFHTREELQDHLARVRSVESHAAASLWDDISHFFGDIWEGIKNGIAKIADFVVDVAHKVVDFTVHIGEEIAQGVKLAITGLEQAAHFIAGVFQAIEAAVEKVIDWLKALFDFGAIWRTKMAFEQGLLAAPPYIKQVIGLGQKAADGWFGKQKATVDKAFAGIKKRYAGQTFGSQPHWQQPGKGAGAQPIVGGASPADFTQNVHHNWFQDKVSAYVPADAGPASDHSLKTPWEAFEQHVRASEKDFLAALGDFKGATLSIIKDPKSFSTVAIPDLLDMVSKVVDALLSICDAIVDGFLALADLVMDALNTLLTAELDLGFINALWGWIATSAGYPKDNKLTMAALISLFGAFPCTIIYKLVAGVDHEPFPDGTFPTGAPHMANAQLSLGTSRADAGFSLGIAMPWQAVFTSNMLQILQVIPAAIGDYLGNKAPWWLTAISVGFSVLIWVLANGYPNLSAIVWIAGGSGLALLLNFAYVGYIVMKSMYATILQELIKDTGESRSDILDLLITIYGFLKFIGETVVDFETTVRTLPAIASILLPMPSMFAFCNLSAIRNDPEVAPFAIAVNLIFDFIGYVGGGVLEAIDTVETRPALQSASA